MAIDPRTDVHVGPERVSHIGSTDFPGHYAADVTEAGPSRLPLQVKIVRLSEEVIEFDLINVDTSIANALRRVLLSEIPTIAIDKVVIALNTSMVQDEVLAHRMGLIPLRINPEMLSWKESTEGANSSNTLAFALSIKCDAKRGTARLPAEQKFGMEPDLLYTNHEVFSGDFVFRPFGDQSETFAPPNAPAPVHDDILLAKLRPGQQIVCEAHCEKGIARDHAKWSAVAKASYRLLPLIDIHGPIRAEHCRLLQSCFPPGVLQVADSVSHCDYKNVTVVNARRDTVSREVLRHPEFANCVKLGRRREHFIFELESMGQYAPESLLLQAINQVMHKIEEMRVPLVVSGSNVAAILAAAASFVHRKSQL